VAEGDREEFAALLSAWAAAIVANDAASIGRLVGPEWVFVTESGIDPGERFLTAVASGDLTHDRMGFEVLRVHIYGDVAVVTSRGTNSGAYRGESFEADEWTTDVFVRRDGSWRCTLTQLTPVMAAPIEPAGDVRDHRVRQPPMKDKHKSG
jgi:ketosteroid isomerase-like protein